MSSRIFFASPSIIPQGTFLNPDELGHTVSALRGERAGDVTGEAVRVTDASTLAEVPVSHQRGVGGGTRGEGEKGGAGPGGGGSEEGGLENLECGSFSFFDCSASADFTWEQCVAKRDACGMEGVEGLTSTAA